MKITSEVFGAYLDCRTKAYLLLASQEAHPHDYQVMMTERHSEFKHSAVESLMRRKRISSSREDCRITDVDLRQGAPLLLDVTIEDDRYAFQFDALVLEKAKSRVSSVMYAPTLFHAEETIRERQKCVLSFGGFLLARCQNAEPTVGHIIFGSACRFTRVCLPNYTSKVQKYCTTLME